MTEKSDKLSRWPQPERSQLEWDESADRITGALKNALPASAVDLLSAPLPKLPEEGLKPGAVSPGVSLENKMSKDRPNRTSFQELAKLASMPPTPPPASVSSGTPPPPSATPGVLRAEEGSNTDSGIVDLKAIATADPAGAQRAQSTPLATEGLFDEEHGAPPASATPPPTSSASPPSAQPAPAVAQAAPAMATSASSMAKPVAKAEEKKGAGGIVIVLGTLVAVGAIAAGVFLYVKKFNHPVVAMTTVSAPDKQAVAQKSPGSTPSAAGSVAQADDDDMDLNVPQANGAKPVGGGRKRVKQQGATNDTPAPTGSAIDPKLIANVPTGPAGGGSGDLAEAMKAAAGGGTGLGGAGGGDPSGPKYAPGSVPQRPSQGQVQGAIGAVMPTVKACLNADDPLSRANVTFQSDGTVKSVTVSGFAAGKSEESCIKAALSKATISPFAEATYSIPVPIRP